jgi:hypothetical protein
MLNPLSARLVAPLASALLGILVLSACGVASAEVVTAQRWERYTGDTLSGQRRVYVGETGMVVEELVKSAADNAWHSSGDLVVLGDRIIINDDASGSSVEMVASDFIGLPGLAALGDAAPQSPASGLAALLNQAAGQAGSDGASDETLQSLLGAAQLSSGSTAFTVTETGERGSEGGIAWDEIAVALRGEVYLYRLADWAAVPGAELVTEHYGSFAALYSLMMQRIGLAELMPGLETWPEDLYEYLAAQRKFPIYSRHGEEVERLVATNSAELPAKRFTARYPLGDF